MRIQDLAIIFIIIILPISIILGAYTQMQISTISLQTEYDMKLNAATSDAIKAFQINTANSSTSDIANSKIRDIEASISTFKESIKSVFGMNGYSEDEMNEYIPALVYTMYDGFYIYSKYNNQNYVWKTEEKEQNGKKVKYYILDNGNTIEVDLYDGSQGNRIPLNQNGENIFGLKPYISYSAKYNPNQNIDIVITYSLDNYISIKGIVNSEYWDESGYLIDGIQVDNNAQTIKYNGVTIDKNVQLSEELPAIDSLSAGCYKYIRYNGTKYYWDERNERIIYFLNGNLMEIKKNESSSKIDSAYDKYLSMINESDSAYQFYKEASEFTNKVKNSPISNLKNKDAQDFIINDNGETIQTAIFQNESEYTIFEFNSDKTETDKNIECRSSNFNQHRLAIIKNKIRTNLATAIQNFNSAYSISFQMPELNEEEWSKVMNNISMISFIQGIDIGGKTYNGYTIINNSESKEVIREENIFILGKDGFYHRIGDQYLKDENNIGSSVNEYNSSISAAGRLNLDFNKQRVYMTNGSIKYYYPLSKYFASYNSIVNQNYWDPEYDKYDDIYAYIAKSSNENLKKAFYVALGRERYGMYKSK